MLLETDASLTNTAALSSFKDIVKTIEIIQTDAESKLAKTATFTPDTLIKSLKTFIASTVLMDSTNRDKITEQLSQAGASNTNKGWGAIEKIITAAADKVDSYAEIFQDKSDLKTVVTIAQEQVKNNPVSGSTENTSNPPSPSPRNDDGPDTTPPSSGMLTVSPSTMSSFAATWSLMLGYSTDNVTPQANILYRAVRVPHPNYLMAAGAAVNCVSPCKVLRDWASYTPVIDVDLPHNTSTYVNIVVKDAAGNATLYPGQNINTSYLSAATDISGTFTYAYVNENNEAHVYRSNLSGSSYISSPLSNPAATNLASKQIAVAIQSSYPYLLYAQPAGEFQEAVLKKHTGSSWETLDSAYSTGQTPGSNFYPHLTPYSSSYMYLSFLTYVSGSRIQHRKWNGSAFADGGYLAFNLYSAISGFYSASYIYWFGATSDDANNRFYKNYPDSNSLSSVVASFPSNTAVGEPVGDAGNTIAVDGSTIYVAYYEQSQNNKIRVARYNGSMIENVSVPEVEGMYDSPYASNASLLFQNGYLYLLYKDNALGGKIYLKKFDPPSSTWSCVACPIWNEEYSVPVMSYLDSNSKVNVAALPIDSNIPVNYQFNP